MLQVQISLKMITALNMASLPHRPFSPMKDQQSAGYVGLFYQKINK